MITRVFCVANCPRINDRKVLYGTRQLEAQSSSRHGSTRHTIAPTSPRQGRASAGSPSPSDDGAAPSAPKAEAEATVDDDERLATRAAAPSWLSSQRGRRWSLHWKDAQLSSTGLALRARAPPDIPGGSYRPVFPHSLKHKIGPYGAQRSTLGGGYGSRRGIATMFLKGNQRHQRIARGQISLGAKSRRNRP